MNTVETLRALQAAMQPRPGRYLCLRQTPRSEYVAPTTRPGPL